VKLNEGAEVHCSSYNWFRCDHFKV
jgi:hypothetical protein